MRTTISLIAAIVLSLGTAHAALTLGEDGLHKQPWFEHTFKDIAEDIQGAAEAGKRLAIIFEQRGCIYCQRLHEEVLSDPAVSAYIAANFLVVQYNLFGDEEVTDLDGRSLSEREAASRWGVTFTPTILFLPEAVPGEPTTVAAAAVSSLPGAFGRGTTLNMFRWVVEKGYEGEEHFQVYHARRLREDSESAADN